jgi:hypothetical protein
MTDEQKTLARRAVACRGWTWGPGMLDLFGRRVRNVWPDDLGIHWSHIPESCVVRDADALPDLSDPATLGCLLALVREVRQEPTGFVVPTHAGGWSYYTRLIAADWYAGDTEAEALLAALEGAP